jgi:hypothetical protein
MAKVWFCQSSNGNINDANKFKDAPSSGNVLTYANLANGDELNMNGKTAVVIPSGVHIDAGAGTSVTVSTRASGAGAAGGNLTSMQNLTLRGNILAGSTTPITTATGAKTLTLIGNVTGGDTATIPGLALSGGHSLAMTGNVTGGSGANTAYGIYLNCTTVSGGSTNITGNIIGGAGAATSHGLYNANSRAVTIGSGSTITGGTGAATSTGFYNASTADSTITATITGGSVAASNYGVYNASTGIITINGNVTGGSFAGNSTGVYNASTGEIAITGNVTSGSASRTFAVFNISTGVVTINGNIIHTITGGGAIVGSIRWTPGTANYETWGYDASNSYYYAKTIPKADVKLGVNGNGAGAPETGTLVVGSGGGTLVGDSVLVSAGG